MIVEMLVAIFSRLLFKAWLSLPMNAILVGVGGTNAREGSKGFTREERPAPC